MIKQRARVISLVSLAAACLGQTPQLIQDVAMAGAEYREALAAWRGNDPTLEKDLFTSDPVQVRSRIRQAAALRDTAMVKKTAYINALIRRLQDVKVALLRSPDGMLPAADLRRDLQTDSSRIASERDRLEISLRDLSRSDENALVRRALESELSDLSYLQENINQRLHSLDSAAKTQEEALRATPPAEKLDAILRMWDQQAASSVRERAEWAGIYAAMDQAVADTQRSSAKAAKGAKRSHKKQDSSGTDQIWTYRSAPSAWTGYGEPEVATLELHDEKGTLSGTYRARLPVQEGMHNILLVLAGSRQSAQVVLLHWKSQTPPAEGQITLRFHGDGKLELKRDKSSDPYIPGGTELLSPR
jgi:hypothetical protein